MKKLNLSIAALLLSCALFAQQSYLDPSAFSKDEDFVNPNPTNGWVADHKIESAVYTPSYKNDGSNKKVKNVILMIGDGMGLAQLCAGMYANGNDLSITRLKKIGLIKTQSANAFVTDSAASGTAYATGSKTNNGSIGVDAKGKTLSNLPELLSIQGIKSAVITTDDIFGATPSVFYAHQPRRKMYTEILGDLPSSKLSLIAGYSRASVKEHAPASFFEEMQKAGFRDIRQVNDISKTQGEKIMLLAPEDWATYRRYGREDYLAQLTGESLHYMDKNSPKGFFMMVEGAKIDHEAHNNQALWTIEEVIDFDKAVTKALRFADRDGQTLVIITADHETGGMSLTGGKKDNSAITGNFGTKNHSGSMVPVYAYGPKSGMVEGVFENTELNALIQKVLKIVKK